MKRCFFCQDWFVKEWGLRLGFGFFLREYHSNWGENSIFLIQKNLHIGNFQGILRGEWMKTGNTEGTGNNRDLIKGDQV